MPNAQQRLSLHPLEFEEALSGLLATEQPPKDKPNKPKPVAENVDMPKSLRRRKPAKRD